MSVTPTQIVRAAVVQVQQKNIQAQRMTVLKVLGGTLLVGAVAYAVYVNLPIGGK